MPRLTSTKKSENLFEGNRKKRKSPERKEQEMRKKKQRENYLSFEDIELPDEYSTLYEIYQNEMYMDRKKNTTKYVYTSDIQQFLTYLFLYKDAKPILNKDTDKTVVDKQDIQDFLQLCKDNGNSNIRVMSKVYVIRNFYDALKRRKLYIGENPTTGITYKKEKPKITSEEVLDRKDIKKIREYLKHNPNTVVELMFELVVSSLISRTALLELKYSKCDLQSMKFTDIKELGGKKVDIYFNETVKKLLVKYKKEREQYDIFSDYVFVSRNGKVFNKTSHATANLIIKNTVANAIYKNCSINMLRMSSALMYQQVGVPTIYINKMLHKVAKPTVIDEFYLEESEEVIANLMRKYAI